MRLDNSARRHDHWYARLFAMGYDPFMRKFEDRILAKYRKQLLTPLQGKVLEIGAGTGVNFPFYPSGAEVWAIEPSSSMMDRARKKLEVHPPAAAIRLILAGVHDPDLDTLIQQAQPFDAIVCTLVLCTIPDAGQAVADIKRWLKPGGNLLLLEHIHAPHAPMRHWQNWLNPVWKTFGEGCNLNRPTDQTLREYGFIPEWEHYFTKGLPFYVAVGKFA